MKRRKPKPSLLPTQEIFNLSHQIDMVREELAVDDAVSYYIAGKWIAAQLNVIAVTVIRTPVPRANNPVP